MLEGWIEKCPKLNEDIEFLECMKCEDFIKLDCIFILCGHKGHAIKRKKVYRDAITGEDAVRCDMS